MEKIINLRFEESNDGSSDGTLIISEGGYDFFFCPITHTKQKEIILDIVGTYIRKG